ncbi:AAA family ATPase [Enterococcus faecium]
MNKYDELKLVFDNEEEDEHQYNEEKYNSKLRDKFRQYIYFGAPGTGKSYQLNKDSKLFLPDKIERVTFHPNMTYGQFVGVFKPFPIEGDKITYRYVPGALMNQLVEALLHPESAFLLIVEELNRANVAAAFGDMFQLLDRKSDFSSEYPINISEDLNWYFENVIYKEPRNLKYVDNMKQSIKNGLIFPSNFYIWTTMNSADQGVMPMDTAFKRRWEQRYFGINDSYNMNEVEFSQYKKIIVKTLVGSDAPGLIAWNDIREFLNERLTLMKVPEDKLMGPYFISKSILESTNEQLTESFKTKVLMYLFDDAAKQRPNDILPCHKIR